MMHYYLKNTDSEFISKYSEISGGFLSEKKSKFYSYLFYVENEDDALKHIEIIKKDNKYARHVVYVYSVIEKGVNIIKFNEDSEPQNTATKALTEIIIKESLANICIVIVRYFGGVLLGAGPLTRAYLSIGKEAINSCIKKEYRTYEDYNFKVSYSLVDIINKMLGEYIENDIVRVVGIEFLEDVNYSIKIDINELDTIKSVIKEYIL